MKKIFRMLLATVLFAGVVGCSADRTEDAVLPTLTDTEDFTAVLADESRTELGADNSVLWSATDKISIFRKTVLNREYAVKAGAGTTEATFKYVAYHGSDFTKTANAVNYGVYPFAAANALSTSGVATVTIPAEQEYTPGEALLNNSVMVGKSETTTIAFKNTESMVRFRLFSEVPGDFSIRKIRLESLSGKLLNGEATVDIEAAEPVLTVTSGTSALTVNVEETVLTDVETVVYAVLPATAFAANDLKITFTAYNNLDAVEGTFEVTLPSALTLERGQITTLKYTFRAEEFKGTTEKWEEAVPVLISSAEELQQAIEGGAENITLMEDIELNQPLVFGVSTISTLSTRASVEVTEKGFLIDGNGYELVYTGSDRAIDVRAESNGANLTLKNLTINCSGSYCQRGVNYNTTGALTLEKVVVKGENLTYAVNLPGKSVGAKVEIKESELTGCIALNIWGANSVVNVTNSILTSVDKATHEDYTAITLNNDGTTIADGTVLTITGGKIIALDENGESSYAIKNNTITAVVEISDSTEVIGTIKQNQAVVIYEGANEFYGCVTLQEAVDKAKDDPKATVRLLRDVEVAETVVVEGAVVLDLNGKTLRGVTTSEDRHIYPLNNLGTLTISNGTIEGRGIYNQDGAKLTINGATVKALDWNGGACVWSYGTGEVYLNNATMIGNTGVVSSEGYLEINGGTYTCYSSITEDGEQLGSPTYNIRAYNGLKITDGTFTSRHGVLYVGSGEVLVEKGSYTIEFAAPITSNVVYINGDAKVTIKDGEFLSDDTLDIGDSGAAVVVNSSDAVLDIYAGTFVGMNGMVSGNDNTNLYGGTYSTVFGYNHYGNLEPYVADGYKAIENSDGSLSVEQEAGL